MVLWGPLCYLAVRASPYFDAELVISCRINREWRGRSRELIDFPEVPALTRATTSSSIDEQRTRQRLSGHALARATARRVASSPYRMCLRIARSAASTSLPMTTSISSEWNRSGMDRHGVSKSYIQSKAVVRKGLRFRGLMGYEGQVLRRPPGPEKEQAAAAAIRSLTETAACLRQVGIPVEILSGGGTGTILVNNAGVFDGGPFDQLPVETQPVALM